MILYCITSLILCVYSAGVGRTGTFIAIDIEIQRINQESLVDVYNCVCRLRFWRNFMVQTVVRYKPFSYLYNHIQYSILYYYVYIYGKVFIMFILLL